MSDEQNKEINNKEISKEEKVIENTQEDFSFNSDRKIFRKNKRKNIRRKDKQRTEFDQKILDIRRVTRVAAGGRRFNFSVSIVVGDRNGRVGVGTGKAGDTTMAIEKATKNAKKNMITVKKTDNNSISHDIKVKYCSARVMLIPAKGRGMVAGSAVRDVIELAGLHDINAKIFSGSKNKLNIARATVKALEALKAPRNKFNEKIMKSKN